MSAPGPRGGSGGPRRPPGPRSGAGWRGLGGSRAPGHATAPERPARQLPAAPQRSGSAGEPPAAVLLLKRRPLGRAAPLGSPSPRSAPPPGQDLGTADAPAPDEGARELSGLRLLLDQLDAMLRDPTLALALKSFTANFTDGVRGLAAAIAQALRQLPRLRLRLPRRLLLALLALTLPLALLALLSSGGDERSTPTAGSQPAAQVAGSGASAALPGVGMPAPASAQEKPKAVRVALVLDRTYDAGPLRRELRTLGRWLAEHHARGTRVTLIDARSSRASAPLRAAELARAQTLQARPSTSAAVRSALGGPRDRRLLVTLGSSAPRVRAPNTLSIATRRGAPSSAPSPTGRRSRVQIDDRRPNTLAASVARAIMASSGQRERR